MLLLKTNKQKQNQKTYSWTDYRNKIEIHCTYIKKNKFKCNEETV